MTDLVSYTPRLPKPGETLHGHHFSIGFGGKGANQCVVATKLGAKTAMVAKLGNDTFGHNYMKNFAENEVNTQHVGMVDAISTGVASIAVDDSGQNSIIIVAGANMHLSEADIAAAESIIKDAKVLICQLEISPASTLAALRLAKKHKVTSILNPAPAVSVLDAEMYELCDIFCPNETEASILTGLQVESVEDAQTAVNVLLDRGCGTVIITLGSQGAVFATLDDRTAVHVAAEKVDPVDTTGAGDAFIGGLAYYLAKYNIDLKESIRRAGLIASRSVLSAGTQTSYPRANELPDELFQGAIAMATNGPMV